MSGVANEILRAFALVVTDRRWAAPLSAMALGFGLFVGVAIGPSAAGSLAGTAQIVEMPSPAGEADAEVEGGAGGSLDGPAAAPRGEATGGGDESPALPPPALVAPEASEPPPKEKIAPEPAPPPPEEPVEGEEETQLKGVVVHANPTAGSYALAIEGGELVPVHARKLPTAGAKLSLTARRLANGTFAESEEPERFGQTSQVSFRGAVTFVDPDPALPVYTVSGRGASVLVRLEPDPSGVAPPLPVLGQRVTVTAGIEMPPAAEPAPAAILRQRRIEVEAGEPAAYLDLAGILTAVMPETSQIALSADDSRESGKDIVLTVPPLIDTARLQLNASYLATATVEEDGSLTLAGLAGDEHVKDADDADTAQGDLKR